ncbi:unnamed protein product [Larinioides sclopetarius]|uniref:CST complex subunit STN1 n=2 Tax=Larinioides sclopetarius TaxID=280406 RepID=A0AAV1ZHS8_9ARAC
MTFVSSSYKKLFICDVRKEIDKFQKEVVYSEVSRTILKAQIMGFITGMKRFHQRTFYTVDDGTGALDCILWQNEPAVQDKIMALKEDLNSGRSALSPDLKSCAQSLLKKAETSTVIEEELYTHGDVMYCLGNVKMFRGNPKLDIHYHYKESDVNAETLWMLDVLVTKKPTYEM